MKCLIAIAAISCALSCVAHARPGVPEQDLGTSVVNSDRPPALRIKIAMGPVSAPHKPGGKINAPDESPPQCTGQSDHCLKPHGKAWHRRHRHPS